MNPDFIKIIETVKPLKDLVILYRSEDEHQVLTLESKERSHQTEKVFYEAMLGYCGGASSQSVQFMLKDGNVAVSFEAHGLPTEDGKGKNYTLKLRLLQPSSDLLENLLHYAKRLGFWEVHVDTDKVLKGQSRSTLLCFSKDETGVTTFTTSEKGQILNFVLQRGKEGEVYIDSPYTWTTFEKLVKENNCLPLCDIASLDITNMAFHRGSFITAREPLNVVRNKKKGELIPVYVVGGFL